MSSASGSDAEEAEYRALEDSVDWAAAERRAEAAYYERFDEEAQRDLALHEAQWPNGYAVCPRGACQLGVYHPGPCDETPRPRDPDADWRIAITVLRTAGHALYFVQVYEPGARLHAERSFRNPADANAWANSWGLPEELVEHV